MLANIGNVRVMQSARVKLGGQVVPIHQVSYTIGDQGPFTDAFEDAQYTPENVQQAQAERIVKLHQIGVPLPVPPEPVPGDPTKWKLPTQPTPPIKPGLPIVHAPTEPIIVKMLEPK